VTLKKVMQNHQQQFYWVEGMQICISGL